MKFLPAENITYKTKLKEEEILKRLSDNVEPEKMFRFGMFFGGSTKPYEGQINRQEFDIKRIIGYRNSFLPRINGIIERDYDGMTIKVKMRLHVLVIAFLCVWCSFVGLACIIVLIHVLGSSEFNPMTLIPFGMLIFVYALTMRSFKYESNKSKRDLQRILEAEIIEE
jgi:hypothetical protein